MHRDSMYNHDVFLFQVDSVQACSIPIQYFGDGAGDCVNERAFQATILLKYSFHMP